MSGTVCVYVCVCVRACVCVYEGERPSVVPLEGTPFQTLFSTDLVDFWHADFQCQYLWWAANLKIG